MQKIYDYSLIKVDLSIYARSAWHIQCKNCIDNKSRFSEKFPLWLPAQEDDVDGPFLPWLPWHLELEKLLKDGNIVHYHVHNDCIASVISKYTHVSFHLFIGYDLHSTTLLKHISHFYKHVSIWSDICWLS